MVNITEKKRVLEVRWAGCQQEEPAPTAGLGEKPAADWDNGPWGMGQKDLVPCLELQSLILDTIRWLKSCTYTATLGYL